MNIDPTQDERIYSYLLKILEIDSINITRISSLENAKLLHIEDSLSVLPELQSAPEGLYGDLGSGGGFPGVPLALATGRQTVLIDSVKKKMAAVNLILKDLQLDHQISTSDKRIEEIALEHPHSFAVLTARALTNIPSLLELAAPLLQDGGHLIALKAHVDSQESAHGKELEDILGMRSISSREYYLSDGNTFRSVYVFEKYKEATIQLPRRIGMAQKKPL